MVGKSYNTVTIDGYGWSIANTYCRISYNGLHVQLTTCRGRCRFANEERLAQSGWVA